GLPGGDRLGRVEARRPDGEDLQRREAPRAGPVLCDAPPRGPAQDDRLAGEELRVARRRHPAGFGPRERGEGGMIFLIGGNGFVGSAFERWCQAQGVPHAILSRQTYDEFRGKKCTVLVNANGNSKKFLPVQEPLSDFDLSVRSVRASLVDFKYDLY